MGSEQLVLFSESMTYFSTVEEEHAVAQISLLDNVISRQKQTGLHTEGNVTKKCCISSVEYAHLEI